VDEHSLDFLLEPPPDALTLRNPLAEDQRVLRPSLIPGLIAAAERNFNRGSSSVAIFEIGRVFRVAAPEESTCLSILLSGERQSRSWNQETGAFDLFDLKGMLKAALRKEFTLTRAQPTKFAPLVCNVIDAKGRLAGKVGQVRPGLAKEIGARGPVFVAEMTLRPDEIAKGFKYKPLDRFPAVTRDVAFLADRELNYQAVLDAFVSANEPLLADVRLFDLFTDPSGENVPADKKSMACSLTYRASDRTLTQEEANAAHGRLKSQLVQRFGVTLRE
jgi:phenylalanyl-tRNA synthetase beta chain